MTEEDGDRISTLKVSLSPGNLGGGGSPRKKKGPRTRALPLEVFNGGVRNKMLDRIDLGGGEKLVS